jgi:hypothetical protein
MSAPEDVSFVLEETQLDLEERGGPSPWLILGIIGVLIALVFGVRGANKRRIAKQEATPTEIGDLGDPKSEDPSTAYGV